MKLKVGGHLSIGGGHHMALSAISKMGGNCLQIFSSTPRIWTEAGLPQDKIDLFLSEKNRLHIDPVYFHASYLVNLADSERIGNLSKRSLIAELKLASKMGIRGSIVHLGSFKGKEVQIKNQKQNSMNTPSLFDTAELNPPTIQSKPEFIDQATNPAFHTLIQNIQEVLASTPKETLFMIENAGNRKIGLTLEEIGSIIKSVGNDRLRVCLDTCHLHAAGYDLSSDSSFTSFLNTFNLAIGLSRLELFHINDSKDDFKSFRDRHQNLGQGCIPQTVFHNIVNNPATKMLSFILETPGFENLGPDQKNIDILKSMILEKRQQE